MPKSQERREGRMVGEREGRGINMDKNRAIEETRYIEKGERKRERVNEENEDPVEIGREI